MSPVEPLDVRTLGQVWTPAWVGEAMATWLGEKLKGRILEPSVGPGALLAAAKRIEPRLGPITAYEIDESVLGHSTDAVHFDVNGIKTLRLRSFLDGPAGRYDAIIANPPYVRHHRMSGEVKDAGQAIAARVLGTSIDRRAGLQVFFLIKALGELAKGGRLAFLVPSDVVEGVFAKSLWNEITQRYRLEGVLNFSGTAAFPGLDTHALVLFISNEAPTKNFSHLTWVGGDEGLAAAIARWAKGEKPGKELRIERKDTAKAVAVGITRSQHNATIVGTTFTELATVVRGIASGDNSYFCFTKKGIKEAGLETRYFRRCIARVGDLTSPSVTLELLNALDTNGRPTYLLNLRADSVLSAKMASYVAEGVTRGVNTGALVSTRTPWYAMEQREVPPILVAYFGRRSERFVKNETRAVPLTGFLCVYPKEGIDAEKLREALNHPDTTRCLADVGKSYGRGATKIEPGSLRKLVIPTSALKAAGLD